MILGRVVLDTNLLIFLVVGLADLRRIVDHKRLKDAHYRAKDHQLLMTIVRGASPLLVTPNILTETSNLLGKVTDPRCQQFFAAFSAMVADAEVIEEFYVPSSVAVSRSEFDYLGLTDSALLEHHEIDFTLLTVDAALHAACLRSGRKAQNFNHLRTDQ